MSRPLGSPPTPASRRLPATTGRSASETPRQYSVPSVAASARSLPPPGGLTPIQPGRRHRRSPSHVPCKSRRPGSRRLYAGHRLASTRAPSKLIPGVVLPPGSDATFSFTTPQRRRLSPGALERLPGPHLTYQVRLFPVAHHDGLQPTQHRVVWRQPPQADAGRPTIFHLLHSTASERCLHRPSFTFMTHRTNELDAGERRPMIASEESLPGCGLPWMRRPLGGGAGFPGSVRESGGVVSHPPFRPPAGGAGIMTMYSGDRAAQSDRRARQGRLRLFFELTRGQATPPGEHSDESDHRVRGFVRGCSEAAQRPTLAGLVPGCSPPSAPGRSVPSAGGDGLRRLAVVFA